MSSSPQEARQSPSLPLQELPRAGRVAAAELSHGSRSIFVARLRRKALVPFETLVYSYVDSSSLQFIYVHAISIMKCKAMAINGGFAINHAKTLGRISQQRRMQGFLEIQLTHSRTDVPLKRLA